MAGEAVTRIRAKRIAKHYKQEYMAARLNCSQNRYSKIEIGKTELSVRVLYHIAAILQTTVAELLPA